MVDPDKLAYAVHLRDSGHTIAQIVANTGITRSSLYRHLPPRPTEQLTLAPAEEPPADVPAHVNHPELAAHNDAGGILGSDTWPVSYRPACPRCAQPTEGLRENYARLRGQHVVLTVVEPCGCGLDDHAVTSQAAAPKITA